MDTAVSQSKPIPKWLSRLLGVRWYEWLGWLLEVGLTITFISVAVTMFFEDETRAGWVMIILTVLFCGPGAWILLKYRPADGSTFGKHDLGLAIVFAIWAILFIYLVGPMPTHEPGPFGNPY